VRCSAWRFKLQVAILTLGLALSGTVLRLERCAALPGVGEKGTVVCAIIYHDGV
jgi:hypothetical protein